MEEKNIRVSICIPTRNRLHYLRSMLPSLLEQAESVGYQVCISDNASTDGTSEYLRELLINHQNIRHKRHDNYLSADESLHAAISLADGEYVFSIGDDDFLFDNALVSIAEELKDFPDLLILNAVNTGPNLEELEEHLPVDLHGAVFFDPHSAFDKINLHHMHFGAFIVKTQFYADSIIQRYYGTCHAHVGAVWDSLLNSFYLNGKCYVKCMSHATVKLRGGIKSWDTYRVKVIYFDIPTFFGLLPCYYRDGVNNFLNKHVKNCYKFKTLLNFKTSGQLTYPLFSDIRRSNFGLKNIDMVCLFLIVIIPVPVAIGILKLKSFFRRFKWAERLFVVFFRRIFGKTPVTVDQNPSAP